MRPISVARMSASIARATRARIRTALVVWSIALAALLSTAGTATAEPTARQKSQAQAYYREGMKLFNLGRFSDAVKEFERAYELDSAPVHLFNIAQAYWKESDYPRAKFFYKRYVVELPNGEKRKAAEDRIAEIDKILAIRTSPPAQRIERDEPRANTVEPELGPVAGRASGSPDPLSSQDQRPTAGGESDQAAGSHARLWPWAIASGAVGVVGIGAGIAASLKVRSDRESVGRAPVFDPAAQASGRRFATLQYIAYGVGAAALAGAAGLWILDARRETSRRVSLETDIGPGRLAVSARMAF